MSEREASLKKAPILLLLLFLALMIAGINLGEVSAVLEKATGLCLSCIGIG